MRFHSYRMLELLAKQLWIIGCCLLLLLILISAEEESYDATAEEGYDDAEAGDDEAYWEVQRLAAKPWYARNVRIGNTVTLPFSYVTLLVVWVSFYWLYSSWCCGPQKEVYVEASHILVTDLTQGKKLLEELKAEIGNNYELFAKRAAKISTCPSKKTGGNLGRFKPGVMAPTFDRLCFNPASPVKTTLGPIQSPFGYHLVYIHDRKL